MKTTVDRIKPTRARLTIELTPAQFKPSIDHAYEHIAKDVNIPGFRKGKVPAAILDQRVGRPAILAHAINDGLDKIYRAAIEAEQLRPIGAPQADIKQAPNEQTFEGNLVIEIEVEVRPEIKLPEVKGLKLTVDDIKVTDADVAEELDRLRSRFGALKTVERAAKPGDFTSIDLVAKIGGKLIDEAQNISYQIGSGNLLDGIDEALETLTAGETTTFRSQLAGGEQAGAEAEITVTLNAVKERELPPADDAFAQLASEFDTLAELKAEIAKQVEKAKGFEQGMQARDKATEKLLELVDVAASDELVAADVDRHLEGEGRQDDAAHRAEVTEQVTRSFKLQMLLDEIGEKHELKVSEQELINFMVQSAQQYGVDPNEFIKSASERGQVPGYVAETLRRKALGLVLQNAIVQDASGRPVNIAEFLSAGAAVEGEHEGHDH